MYHDDPIAAVSTPYGRGGIAVIRISGKGAVEAAETVFRPKNGKRLSEISPGSVVYGIILYDGRQIDDGMASVFHAPHSFTGEDTVEISCHGGILLTQRVLESVLCSGCRAAEAGEFTKRAFLNGKISLSQAEAVIGLIDARSDEQLKLASSLSRGVLHRAVAALSDELTELIASVYAYIDYPDEDLSDLSAEELCERAEELAGRLDALTDTYRAGQAIGDGIRTVIVGKPNAGKSSLLNCLLGTERAIVTGIAGTTRDTIEENVSVGRVMLRLCDTAGIRQTEEEIEKLGVERSRRMIGEAGLILAVFDGSRSLDGDDALFLRLLSERSDAEIIPIVNKTDLGAEFSTIPGLTDPVFISALTGEGIGELKARISDLFVKERIDYDTTPVIANVRQYAAASAAGKSMRAGVEALRLGFSQDVAGMDFEIALSSLRELDGRGVAEEVTDRIFSRFCVGK